MLPDGTVRDSFRISRTGNPQMSLKYNIQEYRKMTEKGIRFSILDLGYMKSDINLVAAGILIATRSNLTPQTYMIDVPIDSILIEVPGYGRILYDLGCDPKGMSEHWPESIKDVNPYYQDPDQTMEHQLGLLGLEQGDIRTVILSHMHVDHAGYLYLFPHAEVIVQRKEFAAAFSYAFEQLDQEGHTLYMRRDITAPVDKYTLIDGDYEVCPGMKCISLPGHSAGMMGLELKTEAFRDLPVRPRRGIHPGKLRAAVCTIKLYGQSGRVLPIS